MDGNTKDKTIIYVIHITKNKMLSLTTPCEEDIARSIMGDRKLMCPFFSFRFFCLLYNITWTSEIQQMITIPVYEIGIYLILLILLLVNLVLYKGLHIESLFAAPLSYFWDHTKQISTSRYLFFHPPTHRMWFGLLDHLILGLPVQSPTTIHSNLTAPALRQSKT